MKKLIRRSFVCFSITLITIVANAHEFWLEPLKFYFSVGEDIVLNFVVGENFAGEPYNLKKDRLERLQLHQGKSISDLRAQSKEGEKAQLTFTAKQEGCHLIAMETTPAFIEQDAEKFNDYLKADGLDHVFNARIKNDAIDQPGKEFYSRHTKLILQVGKKTDDTWSKVLNMPIEIVPEQNPADLKRGGRASFKILFNGKPLFGAKVRVWNRYNHRTMMQPIYAQQDGRIETPVSNPGQWMVSVVHMVPSNDPKADWKSYWGSLVFGVQ